MTNARAAQIFPKKKRRVGRPGVFSKLDFQSLGSAFPNSKRPQHDGGQEDQRRERKQDIELQGLTHVQPPWTLHITTFYQSPRRRRSR
jgi:hypothetical protein